MVTPKSPERKFYSQFDYVDPIHYRVRKTEGLPSMTVKSYANDVNIHSIVARGLPSLPTDTRKAMYGVNERDMLDFEGSLKAQADAKSFFETLPADFVAKFHNNPHEFIEYISDPLNKDEATKLGLFTAETPTAFEKSINDLTNAFSAFVEAQNGSAGTSSTAGSENV